MNKQEAGINEDAPYGQCVCGWPLDISGLCPWGH